MTGLEERLIAKLLMWGKKHGGKCFYPGIPFLIVPAVLVSLIVAEFSAGLTHYPHERFAKMDLLLAVDGSGPASRKDATLIVVPEGRKFFLREAEGGIETVWVSMEPEKQAQNSERIISKLGGLEVEALWGVDYPLVMVVEGDHVNEIDPAGAESQPLAELELVTALSNWVVFFLLAGAVFAFGASTGFISDGLVVEE